MKPPTEAATRGAASWHAQAANSSPWDVLILIQAVAANAAMKKKISGLPLSDTNSDWSTIGGHHWRWGRLNAISLTASSCSIEAGGDARPRPYNGRPSRRCDSCGTSQICNTIKSELSATRNLHRKEKRTISSSKHVQRSSPSCGLPPCLRGGP